MIIAHKIALDPNAAQESYFARACGTARFAYNWALAEWKREYLAGEKPSEALIRTDGDPARRAQDADQERPGQCGRAHRREARHTRPA